MLAIRRSVYRPRSSGNGSRAGVIVRMRRDVRETCPACPARGPAHGRTRGNLAGRHRMKLNRRRVLGLAGATLLTAALSPVFARTKPLRVLILGGTGFIGPHFVHALTAGGHQVTLFNRGKRDPEAKQGVEQLLGDRNDNLESLKGRDWDVVIDNSGYTPGQVTLSTDLLRKHSR